jgi:hypothetical protein
VIFHSTTIYKLYSLFNFLVYYLQPRLWYYLQ